MTYLWAINSQAEEGNRTARICGVRSNNQVAAARSTIAPVSQTVFTGTVELDTHADTIVFGKNFHVLEYSGWVCQVTPYTDTYESIDNVPIVMAATA